MTPAADDYVEDVTDDERAKGYEPAIKKKRRGRSVHPLTKVLFDLSQIPSRYAFYAENTHTGQVEPIDSGIVNTVPGIKPGNHRIAYHAIMRLVDVAPTMPPASFLKIPTGTREELAESQAKARKILMQQVRRALRAGTATPKVPNLVPSYRNLLLAISGALGLGPTTLDSVDKLLARMRSK